MIKLVVTNEKNLELTELEKVHVGENKFGYYLIFLPENLNGYNLTDCEVKLIQVFEDNTSVAIDIDTTQETRPIKEFITLDATSQAQMVTLSVLITHNGNVIGKTNQKTFQVYPTKNATPIDPREELDEIIAELRADKAELETTVSEQSAEITEKNTQITELSGEVTELTNENTRLENQHEQDYKNISILNGEYIKPQGKITFTENQNDVDIKEYAYADVNVPHPSGTIEITQNGLRNVNDYEYANVNVIDDTVVEVITGTLEEYTIPQGIETIRKSGFRDLHSLFNINFNTE